MAAAAAAVLCCAQALAQSVPAQKPALPSSGARIVLDAGEPELRVDGEPFFIHAAQFDYFRIPADLWQSSLERYRQLGINTVDLRIPWNWHELQDGQFDFDGHTNPRRNLRELLHLIAEQRLKLIVRPGPITAGPWRNAGLPDWLLAHSEFGLDAVTIAAGAGSPGVELAARDADAAAGLWLANRTHMTYAPRWLAAVARELAPYGSLCTLKVAEPGEKGGEMREKQISGPLLFVALGEGMGLRPGASTSNIERYLEELRGALVRGGLDAMSFISIPDISAAGAVPYNSRAGPAALSRTGLAGEWISPAGQNFSLDATERPDLKFLTATLATQPDFPPFMADFSASTFAPAADTRAAQPSPANTLLASRLLIGSGLRGIEYSPLQDTLTPAGWETPAAARYFRWDAPLDLAGNKGPRAEGVKRNGQFLAEWGAMLAASHLRADFGILDLRTTLAARSDEQTARAARDLEQVFRAAEAAGFAPELVNPAAQPVERLSRDAVILLPVSREISGDPVLSEDARRALIEFVRRGGALVCVCSQPARVLPQPLWRGEAVNLAGRKASAEWAFEHGRVIVSPGDFSDGFTSAGGLDQSRSQREITPAVESLKALLAQVGATRGVERSSPDGSGSELLAAQLISNDLHSSSGGRQLCAADQLCAAALVSVINFGSSPAATANLEIQDPRPALSGKAPRTISLDVSVPAHDSLLLPIHSPLCSASPADGPCSDEVVAAGAELLGAQRDGKTLQLLFYAPARAMVRLQLESQPTKMELEDDIRLESQWKQETGEAELFIPRGAAPDFLRVLKVRLRYTPHVVEKPAQVNHPLDFAFDVLNAMRFPLGTDASIPTHPPLIRAEAGSGGNLVVSSWNPSDTTRMVDFSINGAIHGGSYARMYPGEQLLTRLRFQPTRASATPDPVSTTPPDGLLRGELGIHSGRKQTGGPVFLVPPVKDKTIHYQYDFDRDGAPELVLESERLQLIIAPADGGRALTLVDKSTNEDLITLGGALYDRIDYGTAKAVSHLLSTREYRAEWVEEKQGTALRLTYDDPEIAPLGARIEKTVRLTTPDAVDVSYRLSRGARVPVESRDGAPSGHPFLSTLSVPVAEPGEAPTRFCWEPPSSLELSAAPAPLQKPMADPQCENFSARGEPISIPEGVSHLEIQTPGRTTLGVEWSVGRARIIPQNFSARVEFAFPLPAPANAPSEFTLRYTIASGL